jgi:hypothetical protein
MEIKDGKGRGFVAEVNSNQQLEARAMSTKPSAYFSEHNSDMFSWCAVSADLATGATLLLVCNNSQIKHLHITKVYCWADVPSQFKIHVPAYPTLAGTLVTGMCWNRNTPKTADAIAYAAETGNTLADANNLIVLRNNEATADEFAAEYNFEGALILGYHNSIAVDVIGEGAAFECAINGYFHAEGD